jgi:hypothetical protein
MQVDKVREAAEIAKLFIKRAEEVIGQSHKAKFLLCDGKHAKLLKKTSTHLIRALTEMRRP